ncbi:MAG TPA: hypothetical protein DD635_03535 [Flavobacteriales bacterium]|nr:hypothetical protein [Flavobacteriales bacterium]|tara:strand:- start:1409 stop:2173 length:765 start_codon:yes stop_codon:yes gene_type:complete
MVTGETDPTAFDGTLLVGWDGERVHWIAVGDMGVIEQGFEVGIGYLNELSHRFSAASSVKLSLLRPLCSLMPDSVAAGIESSVFVLQHGSQNQTATNRTFLSHRVGDGLALIESGHFGADDPFLKAFPLGQWVSSTLAAIELGINEARDCGETHTVRVDLAHGRALMMRFDADALRWCSVTEDVEGDGVLYHVVNSFHREGLDPTGLRCEVVFSGGIDERSSILKQFKRFFESVKVEQSQAELGESSLLIHLLK